MPSLNQLEANRLNAKKSTGPQSKEGQAVSSQNSFKTGLYAKALIIRGERLEDLETLTAEYYKRYEPEDPEERELVDFLIRDTWQIRRYANVEAQLWEYQMAQFGNVPGNMSGNLEENAPLGQAFTEAGQLFARLQRMAAATERSFKENLRELERVQAARETENPPKLIRAMWVDPEETAGPGPEPTPQPVEIPTDSCKIGFVPSTPPKPDSTNQVGQALPPAKPARRQSPVPNPQPPIPTHLPSCPYSAIPI